MLELLFLLLPVAAAYGYIMGKNSAKNQAHEQNRIITSEYSKGLKYLLDREEDQGLEHLIKLLEVSADTVEHYLTLASLFRKRGELDRAIKIHELLLKQPALEHADLAVNRLELALDYIMAGMLDSAEEHLVILIKSEHKEAIDPMLSLYSQMREWQKGINMFEAHRNLVTRPQQLATIANYYCEAGIESENMELIERAFRLKYKAMRPLYELGKQAFIQKDFVKSIYYWRELATFKPVTVPLFIEDLESSYKSLNLEEQFDELIEELLCQGGVLIRIKYCEVLVKNGEVEKAILFLTASLKREPSIRGFSFLLQLLGEKQGNMTEVLAQIDKLVKSYIATKHEYQCQHCGFSSHTLYWLCPSCKHWETILPSKGLDGY
ncbi:lipopolysaccharide assembly protein LapB [Pseudoalteromonas xiamenensis]|uniref:Lipopolysaccharide assembly protein LapB n=1 Tax=Pseudoalteromonas xiamenensis TaxID=882626 RepID=A0A975HL40_9GAMM|nr:lipopolysaccharide assembly protein LapB [Pseudoalteromonas xiamenensis]QTH71562.1 lipopolysaccharide assembly protein LapB [Pseudoalteromonas xiamenensis]WMN59972.1 lipopolysaccharide assembly protein LapB [Pseudoalteromonas xiamenensis]